MQSGRTGDVPAESARIVDGPNRQVEVGQQGIQERTLAHARSSHEDPTTTGLQPGAQPAEAFAGKRRDP